jgi:hypothetical protein
MLGCHRHSAFDHFCCLDYEFSDIEFLFALCEADLEVNLVALIGLDLVFFGAIFEI